MKYIPLKFDTNPATYRLLLDAANKADMSIPAYLNYLTITHLNHREPYVITKPIRHRL